ncbi:hypothetical protein TMatcc_010488 [Talaromyces marneffei ATCC 18224]|uniref:Sld7 C-terminal domain-containing protein n=2 Tax=Talaromyces marneffei TaxID=37727 RepID=B6QVG5_TALMQ|nr:uncharacterized protein EYB26_009723 [Talaromyces marneffei]EEA18970.1 conserved hypothetical protein [Talaromyces marneffei ATCC 18224]QGA22009.1 hypothetical protein EYB26_009723 [Talaromyces marneffei]
MEVWAGSINIDTSSDLKIKLITASQRRENILPKDAKLSLRSLVNPALIPLYARAGSSVELHSTTEDTSEWLKSRLLGGIWLDEDDGAIFEHFKTIQCPVGLLVDVTTGQTYNSATHNVSDLLIYGILSSSHDESRIRPPSPPDSSSLVGENGLEQSSKARKELRIYAAPLAASYAQKVQDIPSPPSSAAGDDTPSGSGKDGTFANFLPDLRSPSPKRKRILSLFEGAAQHHRRVRQREMMPQLASVKIKSEADELGSPMLGQSDLRRARSLSLGGSQLSKLSESASVGDKRPGSSKGMINRRDSKSRLNLSYASNSIETARSQCVVPSPTVDFVKPAPPNDGPEPQSLSSPTDGETLVTRNKDLITRTILTCMRLYGYNRKANRSTKPPTVGTREPSHEPDAYQRESSMMPEYSNVPVGEEAKQSSSVTEEDDFKAMYHATYRAATFALRHYLKVVAVETLPPVLSKDTATNVIDGILKIFCDDQLKPSVANDSI